MARHKEKVTVYDTRLATERSVTLEIVAPQFVIDTLQEGALTDQILAQEAFDTPGRKFVIEVTVRLPKR